MHSRIHGYMALFALIASLLSSWGAFAEAAVPADDKEAADAAAAIAIDDLSEPLYNPFVERYVLDELKQLRHELADTKVELTREIVDREMSLANQAVRYASDTVTYFFYLIAGVSSLLVFIGWNSLRDMKERIHSLADKEISKLVVHYESRLESIEAQLQKKSLDIEKNQEEIDLTREIHSLWLRAAQEPVLANRPQIYDQILALSPGNTEALTYKADTVLEMGEPRWAMSLCSQALEIDPDNAHASYQMACACAQMDMIDQAIEYLQKSVSLSEHYRVEMASDEALAPLRSSAAFQKLCGYNEQEAQAS